LCFAHKSGVREKERRKKRGKGKGEKHKVKGGAIPGAPRRGVKKVPFFTPDQEWRGPGKEPQFQKEALSGGGGKRESRGGTIGRSTGKKRKGKRPFMKQQSIGIERPRKEGCSHAASRLASLIF